MPTMYDLNCAIDFDKVNIFYDFVFKVFILNEPIIYNLMNMLTMKNQFYYNINSLKKKNFLQMLILLKKQFIILNTNLSCCM